MKDKGYFGIGCLNMKTAENYGTLFRTAQILGADFIFMIGSRFKKASIGHCEKLETFTTF